MRPGLPSAVLKLFGASYRPCYIANRDKQMHFKRHFRVPCARYAGGIRSGEECVLVFWGGGGGNNAAERVILWNTRWQSLRMNGIICWGCCSTFLQFYATSLFPEYSKGWFCIKFLYISREFCLILRINNNLRDWWNDEMRWDVLNSFVKFYGKEIIFFDLWSKIIRVSQNFTNGWRKGSDSDIGNKSERDWKKRLKIVFYPGWCFGIYVYN